MRRATKGFESLIAHLTISIHALHEESDARRPMLLTTLMPFQSTLSMRRATDVVIVGELVHGISIHALHEESDISPRRRQHGRCDFNPRSP